VHFWGLTCGPCRTEMPKFQLKTYEAAAQGGRRRRWDAETKARLAGGRSTCWMLSPPPGPVVFPDA
jgi:hypothetical protein